MMYQLRCLRVVHGRSCTAGGAAAVAATARKRARMEGDVVTGTDVTMEVEAAAASTSTAAESLTDEECFALFRQLNPKFVYLVRAMGGCVSECVS